MHKNSAFPCNLAGIFVFMFSDCKRLETLEVLMCHCGQCVIDVCRNCAEAEERSLKLNAKAAITHIIVSLRLRTESLIF